MFKLIYGAVRCVSQYLWRGQAGPSLRVPNKRVKIPQKRNRLVSMAACKGKGDKGKGDKFNIRLCMQ